MTVRTLLASRRRQRPMTPIRATRVIAASTVLVTLVSGLAMHLIDRDEFPTVGRGMWWAAQTVTTVGYGDAVPHHVAGRILALVVMFNAIALLTVVTAAITATLIEGRQAALRALAKTGGHSGG